MHPRRVKEDKGGRIWRLDANQCTTSGFLQKQQPERRLKQAGNVMVSAPPIQQWSLLLFGILETMAQPVHLARTLEPSELLHGASPWKHCVRETSGVINAEVGRKLRTQSSAMLPFFGRLFSFVGSLPGACGTTVMKIATTAKMPRVVTAGRGPASFYERHD